MKLFPFRTLPFHLDDMSFDACTVHFLRISFLAVARAVIEKKKNFHAKSVAQLSIQKLRILLNPGNFFRVQKACFKSENMAQSPEQRSEQEFIKTQKYYAKLCNP